MTINLCYKPLVFQGQPGKDGAIGLMGPQGAAGERGRNGEPGTPGSAGPPVSTVFQAIFSLKIIQ